jgi:hypothetical protein
MHSSVTEENVVCYGTILCNRSLTPSVIIQIFNHINILDLMSLFVLRVTYTQSYPNYSENW